MMRALRAVRGGAAFLLVGVATAQEPQEPRLLRVTVTSAAGRSVYLDKGAKDGLQPGLVVRLLPPGEGRVEATVRAVTGHHARAEVAPGVAVPPPGTPGEVEVPGRAAKKEAAPPNGPGVRKTRAAPPHPPWPEPLRPLEPGTPLLAGARSRSPRQRPAEVSGRAFAQLDLGGDQGGRRDSLYALGRLGARLEGTNLVGLAGRLAADVTLDHRRVDLLDEPNTSDTQLRIDQLSYTLGEQQSVPLRAVFGRFWSPVVPELGLLDGGELAWRALPDLTVGSGFGAFPRPFPARNTGDDLSAHVFVDYASDETHHLAATLAYQKTWHRGVADRDLVVARISVQPARGLHVSGSAKLDLYDGRDLIKGSGVELTELWLRASYAKGGSGGAISGSLYRWPELKRAEFQSLPIELVRDGEVKRVSLSGWHRISRAVRARIRLDAFDDHRDDGVGGDADVDLDGVLEERASLRAGVFYAGGAFVRGPGLRLRVSRPLGSVDASVSYEAMLWEMRGLDTGSASFLRHTVRFHADWTPDREGRWNVQWSGDLVVGDQESAWGLSVFTQYRF